MLNYNHTYSSLNCYDWEGISLINGSMLLLYILVYIVNEGDLKHNVYKDVHRFSTIYSMKHLVSEPNPLRPLRDLQYGLGETVFGGCRHLEYMIIWGFNMPKYYIVCLRQEAQMGFFKCIFAKISE